MLGLQTQTLTRQKEETKNKDPFEEKKIYELPELPKTELGEALANVLGTEVEKVFRTWLSQCKRTWR